MIDARRIGGGVLVAVICIGSVFLPYTMYLGILILGLVCLHELARLCEIKGQPLEYPIAMVGVVAYVVLAAFYQIHKWEGVLLAAIIISSFWLGTYGEQKGYFARTAYTVLAVLYIGKLWTYFIFIRQVPGDGLWLTLYVIVLIALTDIFAMLVGTAIGRHQLTKISPNKTIEGSVGALLIVTAIATALGLRPELHLLWWQGAALGALTCVAAQVGDLVESSLKRDAGVKDTGTVIIGHGGFLDRFDSYLFGGMAFFGTLHLIGVLQVQ